MLTTSARLLRLLSLLQTRPAWAGHQLAERLKVSPRTVRADVDKLRSLGYPVFATPGIAGGYRLGAGAKLPPLLLDDEEAVAVAVSLRAAAGGTVTGIEETSMRALAKLEQVLPSRLRHRVKAVHTYTVTATDGRVKVDPDTLATIAGACRDRQHLRFDYRTHDDTQGVRTVEPHRLVHTGRRWYLLAWDVDRDDWRTFRVDRLQPRAPLAGRFDTTRQLPDNIAAYISRGVDAALFRYRAQVTVHAPADQVTGWLPDAVFVEAIDDRTCLVHAGADTPHLLAAHIAMLDADYEVTEPPELLHALQKISTRCRTATALHGE